MTPNGTMESAELGDQIRSEFKSQSINFMILGKLFNSSNLQFTHLQCGNHFTLGSKVVISRRRLAQCLEKGSNGYSYSCDIYHCYSIHTTQQKLRDAGGGLPLLFSQVTRLFHSTLLQVPQSKDFKQLNTY